MQQVLYGTIRKYQEKERIFEILIRNKIEYFYLTRSQLKRFRPYLQEGLFVHVKCRKQKTLHGKYKAYEVINFVKMLRRIKHKTVVYFDIATIKRGVRKLLSRDGYRMFLDLEFTMPPYHYTHGSGFVAEIIQYGIYLEDEFGQVILADCSMVRPTMSLGLNARTYDFLSIDKNDLNDAISYHEFYDILNDILMMYQPVIYVWGKNDIIMLEKSYEMHHRRPLIERRNFVNLMQVLKNYYGYKTDIGLFNAYQLFGQIAPMEQDHDALHDAFATSEIFRLFQKELEME